MRAIVIVLVFWSATLVGDEKKDGKLVLSEDEKGVLERTNAERKAAGLPELVPNEKLFKAARDHSANMAKQDKLDHVLDEKGPADRVKALAYEYGRVGENVAWNQPDAAAAVKSWMESEHHKANILNKDYTEIGIGVAKNARGELYWTQVFGTPLR